MMDDFDSLSHSRWECKYHVVFIRKCRRKVLYAQLSGHLGELFRRLAQQKESRVEEGHLMSDHAHMLLWIPPKYAVSQVVGYRSMTLPQSAPLCSRSVPARDRAVA
jgi:putative transposase